MNKEIIYELTVFVFLFMHVFIRVCTFARSTRQDEQWCDVKRVVVRECVESTKTAFR